MQERYAAYADLALDVGLSLQAGQRLWLSSPVSAAPLARAIVAAAYKRGARYVEMNWTDDGVTLARFQHAPRDSFAEYPVWHSEAMLAGARQGDAFLSVRGTDPQLLKDQDPDLVTTVQRTGATHRRPFLTYITSHKVNWCVLSVPIPAWAHQVFPGVSEDDAMAQLWEAIGGACRLNEPDPVAAYGALHFVGPGTDLTVGLVPGHRWIGGSSTTDSGITFTPNVPTEEVFSLPHKDRVDGTVTASKPLNYGGTLIEGLKVRFVAGRAVEVTADAGQSVMQGLIDTDEGSARLGEVALVPASSPISMSGVLFYDTLFDENAASHIAIGKAYSECLQGGHDKSAEELAADGVNDSLTHVDFMIGGAQMDVSGVRADGSTEPVMEQGEWVG
ncbi:MAG: aminopeptidase [bacterium]|nr:aminopeptidase [bacterium]